MTNAEMEELVCFLRNMPMTLGSKKVRVVVQVGSGDRDRFAQVMLCLTEEQRAAISWEEEAEGAEELGPKDIVRRGQA